MTKILGSAASGGWARQAGMRASSWVSTRVLA